MKHTLRVLFGIAMQAILVGCTALSSTSPHAPSVTSAPGAGLTPAASPIPTATETPIPVVRVGSGDQALFNGDMDAAMVEYRSAAAGTSDPDIRQAALWGMARAQYSDAYFADAISTLDELKTAYPTSSYLAAADFLRGQSLFALRRYAEAASAYQGYLNARPGVLDSYAGQLRGDALAQAGNYSEALTAYASAQAAPHLDDAQALQIKIAQTTAQTGDYSGAIYLYDTIATNTTNDYTRAQMDYLAGEAYLAQHQTAQAYERFKHAVENYPLSYYSYQGLVELLGANVPVNDLDRGLTDYFAGVYDKALESFDRYLAAIPAGGAGVLPAAGAGALPADDGTAHYYRALCLEHLDQAQAAVDAFTNFINNYPSHSKWPDAWDEKSTIQWVDLNLYPQASQTMLDYVKAASTSSHAPEALMSAARILERDGRFDQAGQIWQRVANEYPTYSQASMAVFFSGLMQYRQADYNAALPLFEHSLVLATVPEDQARAYVWIGKTQEKLGRAPDTQNAWQLAQSADPGGYYSERASDLLMGRPAFSPPTKTNLDSDLPAERKAADSWIRLTFKLPLDTDLSGLGPLASEPRLIRGRELWNLGLLDEARLEFEDLRTAINGDAVLTYRLANFLLDLGLYRSGIQATRQVLTLAGLADQPASMLAPPYFSHIRYGLYYRDLILLAAQSDGIDPLFLFSVVRQESLFEGFVSSTAGARGLMQIVPGTGAGIARTLGWPINYEPEMLYRPNVSIAFGAYYLSSNRSALGGDLYTALAAYNAGPGNAQNWNQLAQGDPDLFLESVRAQETRDYIRSIYEYYVIYRHLYGPGS